MPRLALKPDSSFFRKIALGAIGTRRVCEDLTAHGHEMYELERGSLDTKLWKEVKRKRVRIPDLVCSRCGVRVESRAKTKAELSMSHSPTDAERAWDFGMVESDWIAFPVCRPLDEKLWTYGRLGTGTSYWHERNWVEWQMDGCVNYFTVAAFRSTAHAGTATKGVTEGSETTLSWAAIFSTRAGDIPSVDGRRVTIRRESDGHRYTRSVRDEFGIFVSAGDRVDLNQLIAGPVKPLTASGLTCSGVLPEDHISHLLSSRERTQRFTGVKLARLREDPSHAEAVRAITGDEEEDVYIRLEGASYLVSVCGAAAADLFTPFLERADPQIQLETVIALGEADTPEAVDLISNILDDETRPYFLRSAAAWALSRTGEETALNHLIKAFGDVDQAIREEALQGVVSLGGTAVPMLLVGLREVDSDLAAGCAEALRQQDSLPDQVIEALEANLRSDTPAPWAVWLVGHLARTRVAGAVAGLEASAPQLHYAITLLWSFVESWIARRWELNPGPILPRAGEAHDVDDTV